MDRQEAKWVLQAYRPNDLGTTEPAVAEALALAEKDPELKTWWKAEQAFDQKVAAKLREVPVPPSLRATILAGRKIVPFAPQPLFPIWLAAAAVVAILCVAGSVYHASWKASLLVSASGYEESALDFLGNNDRPSLGMLSPDHGQVMAWLKSQNAPTGKMPPKISALPSVGCQKFVVHGHNVSLICFTMAEGKVVHLFVVARDALADPPGGAGPDFKQIKGWSTAAWSDGRMTYMLATQAGDDALKQLL